MQPRGVPSQDAPIPVNKYCNRVFKLDRVCHSISILLPAAIGKLTSHPGPGVEEEEEEEEEGGRGAAGT